MMDYLMDATPPERRELIESSRWIAVEWTAPNETTIDGMDGTFQVLTEDGDAWVCDAHSMAEAEQIAEKHNKGVSQ